MNRNSMVWMIGSNSDIAKTFVEKYISEFGNIILASRDVKGICQFSQKFNSNKIKAFELDIRDESSIDSFLETAPIPDVVIICAGHIRYSGEKEDFSSENIITTYRTNTVGLSVFVEKLYKILAHGHNCTVVALSSCAGDRGKSSNRIYAASKAAMSVYFEGFMQDAEKHGIKTVLIKLGRVNTKMLEQVSLKKQRLFSCSSEKAADFIMAKIRKNRSGIYYYRKIWKIIMNVYCLIPLKIYNKINF